MKKKDKENKLKDIYNQQEIDNLEATLNRARSITIGTCFGGTTEVIMRDSAGRVMWSPMQPVEVVELIHQLAANIGCHINLVPRNDFASWRAWNYSKEELEHYRGSQILPGVGHAPHSNDMAPHRDVGRIAQQNLENNQIVKNDLTRIEVSKEETKDETLAIKKNIKKRATKRSTTST